MKKTSPSHCSNKAARPSEIPVALDLQPLALGDPRYVDLAKGRESRDLYRLRAFLQRHDAAGNRFAKAVFTGHRGSGKTTELLRLMSEVSGRFTPMLMVANEALIGDYEYTDLFLWLVDQLVWQFREGFGCPLDDGLVKDTENWFAEVTKEVVRESKSEVAVETEAEVGGKIGWFGIGVKFLGRLRSMVVGSVEHRQTIRRELQRYSFDLVNRVNLLLDNAYEKLKASGRPANLLLVVDNLDRLTPDAGRRLFLDNSDQLQKLKAHVIYTVPVASVLAPVNIGRVFEHSFTLPMVRVRDPDGKKSKKGIDLLLKVLDERVDRRTVFSSSAVAERLVRMSGGSLRDLLRLVNSAWLDAEATNKQKIDLSSATQAMNKLRIEYQRILIPGQVYYPILAKIHETHQDWFEDAAAASADKVQEYRRFFSELLFNGAVLEYDGGESWYDVHPVIEQIDGFKKALTHATAAQS